MFKFFALFGTVNIKLLLYLDIILSLFAQEIHLLGLDCINLEYTTVGIFAHVVQSKTEVVVVDWHAVELSHSLTKHCLLTLDVTLLRLYLHVQFEHVHFDLSVHNHFH